MSSINQATTSKKASGTVTRNRRKNLANPTTLPTVGIKTGTPAKRKNLKGSGVFSAKIRAIGNSKGVIINNQLLEASGINADIDLIMYANEGKIILMEAPRQAVNTDLATWDKHFKAAIKKGAAPDTDLFEGMDNNFDKNEW